MWPEVTRDGAMWKGKPIHDLSLGFSTSHTSRRVLPRIVAEFTISPLFYFALSGGLADPAGRTVNSETHSKA